MISLKSLCREAMATLTRAGAWPGHEVTGLHAPAVLQDRRSLNPRQQLVFHYADLRGPLYADRSAWALAHAMVRSFTPASVDRGDSGFLLPALCGPWPVPYQAMLEVVPEVLQAIGLTRLGGRRITEFAANDECLMEALPEPYGKWFQHVEHRPRWGERVKLRLKLSCTLRPLGAESTTIDLALSTFAPSLARSAAERLASEFDLPALPTGADLCARPSLVLAATPIDLAGRGRAA